MSETTQEHAHVTEEYLRSAERHLHGAEKHAVETGDKSLVREIQKSREVVTKVREDLTKKLEG